MSDRTERAKSTIKGAVAPDAAAMQAMGTTTDPIGTSNNPSHQILTVANVITFTRLILTGVFFFLFTQRNPETRGLAVTLYTIAAITDFLDGYIARATNTVSWLGKVMDPIMDRVLLFTGVIALVVIGELPLWVALIVVGRDIILFFGTLWLRVYQTRPMDVIFIGKVATAFLMFGFADMLINAPRVQGFGITDAAWLPGFNSDVVAVGIYCVYIGLCFSVVTAITYYRDGLRIRRAALDAEALKRQKQGS